MRHYLRIFAWILVAGGVFFLARAGYYVYEWNERIKIYEIAQGVVAELVPNADSTQFFPVISFRAMDNQKLQIRSRRPDASVHVGDSVQVLYDIANPDDMLPVHQHPIQHNSQWVSFAAVLLAVGLAVLFRQWQQHNHRQLLQVSGRTVLAAYDTTETFTIAGLHFYRAKLTAQISYPQEQTLHFTSEWFMADPAPHWEGKMVKVHINVSRESDYWVNTEWLPPHILI